MGEGEAGGLGALIVKEQCMLGWKLGSSCALLGCLTTNQTAFEAYV